MGPDALGKLVKRAEACFQAGKRQADKDNYKMAAVMWTKAMRQLEDHHSLDDLRSTWVTDLRENHVRSLRDARRVLEANGDVQAGVQVQQLLRILGASVDGSDAASSAARSPFGSLAPPPSITASSTSGSGLRLKVPANSGLKSSLASPKHSPTPKKSVRFASAAEKLPKAEQMVLRLPPKSENDKVRIGHKRLDEETVSITMLSSRFKETVAVEVHGDVLKFICSHIEVAMRNGKMVKLKKKYSRVVNLPWVVTAKCLEQVDHGSRMELLVRKPAAPRAPSPWVEVNPEDKEMAEVKQMVALTAEVEAVGHLWRSRLARHGAGGHAVVPAPTEHNASHHPHHPHHSGGGSPVAPTTPPMLTIGGEPIVDPVSPRPSPVDSSGGGGGGGGSTGGAVAGAGAARRSGLAALPLHVAITEHDAARVQELIDAAQDVNAIDGRGRTPMHMCCRFGSEDVVEALVAAGARVQDADKYGATPLHHAAACERGDVACILLEQGASVCDVDADGMTPLHVACMTGNMDLLRVIVDTTGDEPSQVASLFDQADFAGFSPLQYAPEATRVAITDLVDRILVDDSHATPQKSAPRVRRTFGSFLA